MTVRREDACVYLEGQCRVEDAEPLSAHLQSGARRVDVSGCDLMHASVFQALIAFKPEIQGAPAGGSLADWLAVLPGDAEN